MRYSITKATVEQVKAIGGSDIKETKNINIIFTTLTDEQVAQLKAQGCLINTVGKVKAIVMPPTPIAAIPKYTLEYLSWAIGLEEIRSLTIPPLYGAGYNLAIIDTGIRESHKTIDGHVIYSKNYTTDPMEDTLNHGTGIASIVITAAPLCGILNLKVCDAEGNGSEESVVMAIDDCISFQVDNPQIAPAVINLSIGSPDDGNKNNPVRVACRTAIDKGIWIVACAGNSGPNPGTILCPACERYVGAIGSCKYEPFIISEFSSRGPTKEGLIKPDAVFFGEDIIVASSESDIATTAKSGTSFSAPFMSASALLYNEGYSRKAVPTQPIAGVHPELGIFIPIQDLIDKYLMGVCVKPQGTIPNKDNDYGCGLPFAPIAAQALRYISSAAPLQMIMESFVPIISMGMMIAVVRSVLV